jgi:menaquinol-cytochrome c reductase cytochrome b/c subunit
MPDIPEHLLRRSAEARAEALGVPLEQVLAEMGLAGEGETPPAALEEITLPVQPANPDTTIPDDLRAREAAARQAAVDEFEAKAAPAPPASPVVTGAPEEPAPVVEVPVPVVEKPAAAAAAAAGSKIPEALLRRSAEAKAKATGRPVEEILAEMSGGAPVEPAPVVEVPVPVVEKPAAAAAAAAPPTGEPTAPAQAPTPAGDRTTTITAPPVAAPQGTPEGVRPQRLLTVVRAKAIQQVKAEPTDKVSVWPHLLLIEFVALLGVTAFLTVLSVILQAPLLDLANFNLTPNPSKAPWYFLGLQELLSYFDPQIGGVTVPGVVGLLGLMAIPYVDRNPSTKPSDRKFAIMFFTFFLVASATLTMLGTLFRGPGFNFSYPWSDGIWFDDLKDWISFE